MLPAPARPAPTAPRDSRDDNAPSGSSFSPLPLLSPAAAAAWQSSQGVALAASVQRLYSSAEYPEVLLALQTGVGADLDHGSQLVRELQAVQDAKVAQARERRRAAAGKGAGGGRAGVDTGGAALAADRRRGAPVDARAVVPAVPPQQARSTVVASPTKRASRHLKSASLKTKHGFCTQSHYVPARYWLSTVPRRRWTRSSRASTRSGSTSPSAHATTVPPSLPSPVLALTLSPSPAAEMLTSDPRRPDPLHLRHLVRDLRPRLVAQHRPLPHRARPRSPLPHPHLAHARRTSSRRAHPRPVARRRRLASRERAVRSVPDAVQNASETVGTRLQEYRPGRVREAHDCGSVREGARWRAQRGGYQKV